VPREDDHDVRDEPRSGAVDPRSSTIAREYWGRVPLCDKAKVSNVVFAAKQAGYEERDIRRGLRTLAKESRPVTPDTLRIAIEGKTSQQPKSAYTPPRDGRRGREGW
jgi:hypothetical protein